MEQTSDILGRSELFEGLAASARDAVAAAGFHRRLGEGEALLRQGDAADGVFLVLSGLLRASQTTAEGQQVAIRYLGPGDVAGYTALTGGSVHPGTVSAVEDSEVLGWANAAFRRLMAEHPAIAMNALALLGTRYHEMQVRLRELTTEPAAQRIGRTLLRLARQAGRRSARGVEIAFPLSRQDVAEMSGTTLHTASRTLADWEERGLVDSGRLRIVLRAPQALAELVGEDDETA